MLLIHRRVPSNQRFNNEITGSSGNCERNTQKEEDMKFYPAASTINTDKYAYRVHKHTVPHLSD